VINRVGWTVTITAEDQSMLHRHLFQRGWREHAAFLLAGHTRDTRLLVRTVVPIPDEQFTARQGHYEIAPAAVASAANRAARDGLALIWAHSHPGSGNHVAFSPQDHATIERAHPALMDITDAPVGALVFGEAAVAGHVSLPSGATAPVAHLRVLGPKIVDLHSDMSLTHAHHLDERHARQVLLFGEAGQRRLRGLRVTVLGAGGGGSLLLQQLAHLGVGELTVVDFDTVSVSNLSRVVGARRVDAMLRRRKVRVARRLVRRIDRTIHVAALAADAADATTARKLAGSDAIFVATDTALGRHAANALAYQFMVPVFVVGAKVQASDDGSLATIHSAVRIAMPGLACLHCQGAIPADRLHTEQLSGAERRAQDYLGGGEDIVDPSVISLNGIAASTAVTDFLLMICGLLPDDAELSPTVWYPLERRAARRPTPRRHGCGWCDATDPGSALGRGDTWPLALPNRPYVTRVSSAIGRFRALASKALRHRRR
jgi:hypothetical protein